MSVSLVARVLHRSGVALLLCGVLLGATGQALAQSPTTTEADPAQAQKYFDQGLRFYNIGEYDRAAEAFRSAYLLNNTSRYLFSMAQAFRMKGDCAKAIEIYESYRRTETSEENRQAADRLIEQARACAQKQQEKAAEKAAVAPPPAPRAPLTAAAASEPEPAKRSWLPWVVVGVGGALAITGVILAASAASEYSSLQKECGDQCDPVRWQGLDTREKIGYALLISGAAATVGGLTWWYLGSRQGHPAQRAWIAPTLGGLRVGSTF